MMPVFLTYPLTPSELVQAESLNYIQTRGIQNLIAQIAEEKLHLKLDPTNTNLFIQQEAYLSGQIEVLEHLLARSDESTRSITLGEI